MTPQYVLLEQQHINGPHIVLDNYRQRDSRSCGFVAALTVATFFDHHVDPSDVFAAISPTEYGIDKDGLVTGLQRLGISAEYRDDLELTDLLSCIEAGTPVILSVYPERGTADHWTVVRGFSLDGSQIHLANCGILPVQQFLHEWFDKGEGLVCRPMSC